MTMGRSVKAPLLLAAALLASAGAFAGKAHQHGHAQLAVAVDPQRITISLDTPLDNLVGFERAPRDDAAKKRVDEALARLRDTAALWRVDPAAQCKPDKVEITAPVLGLGAAAPAGKNDHADVEVSWEFACAAAPRAGFVETGLFEAFARLKQVAVQAASPKGQIKASLKRPASRIALAR
jgi:hypothetical protein